MVFMIRFALGALAALILLLSCGVPVMARIIEYDFGFPREIRVHGEPLFGFSWPAALILFGSSIAIVLSLIVCNERILRAAGTLGGLCALLMTALVVRQVAHPNASYLYGLFENSTFYAPRVFAWGFWVLLCAIALPLLAAWWPQKLEDWENIVSNLSQPRKTAPQQPLTRPIAPKVDYRVPGLPDDVGLCAKCQSKNSRSLSRCHACGEILPWARPKPRSQTPSPVKSPVAQKVQNFDWIAIALTFLSGALIFLFSLIIFPLGIFLWRYLDEQNSRFVNVALTGWILGIVLWVGRFLLIIALAGSR